MAPMESRQDSAESRQWSTPREALRVCFLRATLRRAVSIALFVGTILSLINQGNLIVGGNATTVTWIRVAANFVVPFLVSSAGFLSATHRKER